MRPLIPVGPSYGWVVAGTLTVLLAISHGLIGSGISVFDAAILHDLHISRATLKLRDVVQLFGGGLWAMAIGFAADRLGPRTVIYAGLLTLGVALFGYGYVTDVRQIYALHVLLAFAYSSCHVVVVLLVLTRWFAQRRSTALGIILAGESLGGSILPPVIAYLIGNSGWRESMHMLALLPVGLALLLVLLLRGKPQDFGQMPVGGASGSDIEQAAEVAADPSLRIRDYLRSGQVWLILAIGAALFYTGGGVAAHSFLYFSDRGFNPEWAASSLSLIFVGGLVGKSCSGFLSERWPGLGVWMAFQATMLVGVTCLTIATPLTVWPGVALFGLGWGGSYTLTQANVMERFRGPYLGRLAGLIVLVEGLSAGIGSFMGGLLHDITGSYTQAYLVMTASVLLAIVLTQLLRMATLQPVPVR
ncbi:MFS transporter [Novosphingobium sp. BL-52-GroH]|uniref:MFS transporter n=1 Tax=Novosphingobium sp. BL-52-GroH TaxID=3349877 RepID=UPI00384E41BB